MANKFRILVCCLFLIGCAARLSLYAVNPPLNAYDDHFAPVEDWIELGARPPHDSCWECHQPPLFYGVSVGVAKALLAADVSWAHVYKTLQFLPCLAGLLTLPVLFVILRRFELPPLASCLSFGIVCLLPRHIYLSSTYSNDTLSFLFAALAVWLALGAIDRPGPTGRLVLLSLSLTAAIFTKLTALALLPALMIAFGWLVVGAEDRPARRRALRACWIVFLLPALLLAGYFVSNKRTYGSFITDVQQLWQIELTQEPGADELSFVSFVPWRTIETPFLAPGQVHSFWTQIHGRTWFDMEPRLMCFTPATEPWCDALYAYLDGVEGAQWPGPGPHAPARIAVARLLVALGLLPLLLLVLGAGLGLRGLLARGGESAGRARVLLLLSLLFANIAGIATYTLLHPFYSSMKATYLLLSLPCYALFVASGLAWCERRPATRRLVVASLALLFAVAIVHVAQTVQMLDANAEGFFPSGPTPRPSARMG